jgi:hypothetical protein
MAENHSPPSIDPAIRNDAAGTLRFIMQKFLQGVDTMLPARVVAYDRETNRARVQPLIAMLTTDGRAQTRAQVASVPVLQLGGGGFVISFPIQTGDLGWIKAADRDISLFLQSYNESPPNTNRLHTFEDGWFIPDTMMRQVEIQSGDENSLTIQSLDGSTRIVMGNGSIDIFSETLTHNGRNIGSTHTHDGVMPGGGDTGPPNVT